MNWEYSHLAMAAGAGRLDQLRDEASSYRQSRELLTGERSHRAKALRTRLGKGYSAVANLWRPYRPIQQSSPRYAAGRLSVTKHETDTT